MDSSKKWNGVKYSRGILSRYTVRISFPVILYYSPPPIRAVLPLSRRRVWMAKRILSPGMPIKSPINTFRKINLKNYLEVGSELCPISNFINSHQRCSSQFKNKQSYSKATSNCSIEAHV